MRQKYVYDQPDFLSEHYNPMDVFAMSSMKNRTFLSAVYEVRGLYPNGNDFDDFTTTSENSAYSFPYIVTRPDYYQDQLILDSCEKIWPMYYDAYDCDDFQYVLDYFETNYLPRFKELVGEDDIEMV